MHNTLKACRAAANSEDDEIVISGMSGRFPSSRNVAEFEHNLYNKVDMIINSNTHWKQFYPEIPARGGKIDSSKFDATFFGVHCKLANDMDPGSRILLEVAYEAILDAGINPKSLTGSNTGVYIGSCGSDSEKALLYDNLSSGGLAIMGCSRAMLANRISFSFGFHGPSLALDSACSSSMYALDCAYSAMRNGEIDAAIVGGCSLTLNPLMTCQFLKLGVLSPNGFCRPFDEAANGYVRSEAISCIFLQRKRDCKRIYATIVHCKTNSDGFKAEGILYPSRENISRLFKELYAEARVDPKCVSYVEAHSTGTVIGDPEECAAIDAVLCKDRLEPLLVGSVKSNIGHTEPASGICGIIKALLALEKRKVAPNIHFNKPRSTIAALIEGRIKVATEIEDLKTPYIAVDGFGFGGSNAHLLLKGSTKEKQNNGVPLDTIPRLVFWSGRNEESVHTMLNAIESRPLDAEFIALANNIQKETTPGFVFRGFGLFSEPQGGNTTCISKEVQHFNGFQRPVVWVFSGMGSQWTTMGASLMGIPIFSEAINRCHNVLKPKGIDLINVITSTDDTIFHNILHSFVGIAAIQIGIVDVLRALGLEPDYIIGHSVGELGCAYADGALTAEQMILASYARGKVSLETDKIKGSMAAVGLGYQAIVDLLPPMIEVACHNSAESSTISGPSEDVEKFVAELNQKGIFAKEVAVSNIAYHSRYIANMGPHLLKNLRKIIPNPVKRSSKWLSTSVPKHQWNLPQNELCSAEYHTNNLLNSVLFEETALLLPQNAICIEIAPHGLLQAILRKSMPDAVNIPLTQRGNKHNMHFFLSALGKMYTNGLNLPIERLYPEVNFPVSRGTSMISSLVKWDHSDDWFVANFDNIDQNSGEKIFKLNLENEEHAFIAGHMIDGKVLVPATYYLQMVWETYTLLLGKCNFVEVPVEFTDVRFMRATPLSADKAVILVVIVQHGTGDFEVSESGTTVVKGNIAQINNPQLPFKVQEPHSQDITLLDSRDFYKELRLRGYHYAQLFKGVLQARSDGLAGRVRWADNWVSFMDTLLQVQIVGKDSRALMLPTRLEKLRIDSLHHLQLVTQMNFEDKFFDVKLDACTKRLVAGGIEVIGLHATTVSRRKPPGEPVLESYHFIPNLPAPDTDISEAIRICVQTALEDNLTPIMKVVEVDQGNIAPVIPFFQEALEDLPVVSGDLVLLSSQQLSLPGIVVQDGKLSSHNNCMFVVSSNLLGRPDGFADINKSLAEKGYLVSIETSMLKYDEQKVPPGFTMLAFIPTDLGSVILMRRTRVNTTIPIVIRVSQTDTSYTWLTQVQAAIQKGPVLLVAEKEKYNGLIGMVNCLRKEPGGRLVTCVVIEDSQAPAFDLEHPFYAERLKLGLPINMFRHGKWGFNRHFKLKPKPISTRNNVPAFVKALQQGDMSSLVWVEASRHTFVNPVKVMYASLNFRDIMAVTGRVTVELTSGRFQNESDLGLEFSGIGMDGKRYMGVKENGCMTTHVQKPTILWEVPETWSLAEAASVPCVYVTVYMAFFQSCDIRKGKTVLIHSGTGGVGHAAIAVALAYGLEVFTTVGTQQKKHYLLQKFPQLKESHIGNSRDTSFEYMIAEQTQGRGVDFVLNSLAEEKLLASVRCLARKGRFLEIGKFDILNNNKIGLAAFSKEISFHAVMADQLLISSGPDIQEINDLISKDIRNGIIKPIPTTVFKADEVEKAFRFMAAGKHVGKVMLSIHDESEQHKLVADVPVLRRLYFNPAMVYVIPGGLGGFGLELADWLILRNASKIVLSSSRGISNAYQQYRIKLWKSYGVQVQVSTDDITTYEGCQALLNSAMKLGPIGGIFNLAVQLRDAIFANHTPDTFRECMAPKAIATKFLDEISRRVCPQLEYFVVFSSVSCGRGNGGQTNYGMANSVMERIMEQRASDGLPAKAVQWGAVGEVGIVADLAEDHIDMEIGGTLLQRISSCLQELDNLLTTSDPVVSCMVVAEKRIIQAGNIMEAVMNIIGIRDIKSISVDTTLTEAGMDSMATVEIKQTLEREFDVYLSPQELRAMTFQRLQEISSNKGKESVEQASLKSSQDNSPFGIGLLLRNLGDEQNCYEVILPLATNVDRPNSMNPSVIVPGIEGVAGHAWHTLAMGLRSPANMLQLMTTAKKSSVRGINDSIFERVLNSLDKSRHFYLIGYSFGSLVTLDLAYRLEQVGFQGKVALIDGAPLFLQKLITRNFGKTASEKDFQALFFTSVVIRLLPSKPIDCVSGEFAELPDWNSRMNKFLEYISTMAIYSHQYLESCLHAIYTRLLIMREMSMEDFRPIKSNIVLIRTKISSVPDIAEDYELSKCTLGKVVVNFIEGDHTTMLDDPKLVRMLNDHDPSLQTEHTFNGQS